MDAVAPPPQDLSASTLSVASSSADRRSSVALPRIRTSRFSAPDRPSDAAAGVDTVSSVSALAPESSAAVVGDVVSPLSPTASERPAPRPRTETTDAAARPLTQMLRRMEVAERCRWSGLMLIVLYIVTVLIWPSLLIPAMGMMCGASGFVSCLEPYSIHKVVWVFMYAFLNIVMLITLAWVAIDQLVVQDDENSSVNWLYISAFVLLGFAVHVRSYQAASELIQRCQFVPILADALIPEQWRPQSSLSPQVPTEEGTLSRRLAPEDDDDDDISLYYERDSPIHSFEVDIEPHEPEAPPLTPDLSSPSPPASPASASYRKMDDTSP